MQHVPAKSNSIRWPRCNASLSVVSESLIVCCVPGAHPAAARAGAPPPRPASSGPPPCPAACSTWRVQAHEAFRHVVAAARTAAHNPPPCVVAHATDQPRAPQIAAHAAVKMHSNKAAASSCFCLVRLLPCQVAVLPPEAHLNTSYGFLPASCSSANSAVSAALFCALSRLQVAPHIRRRLLTAGEGTVRGHVADLTKQPNTA